MSFYFSSDGTLKMSTRSAGEILNSVKNSSYQNYSASSSSSSSSFSAEVKNAALSASSMGISKSAKDAARANSAGFQRYEQMQARIREIASRKPRTFDDDDDWTFDTTAIKNYTAAQEAYYGKKSSTVKSLSTYSAIKTYTGSNSNSSSSSSSNEYSKMFAYTPSTRNMSMFNDLIFNSSAMY